MSAPTQFELHMHQRLLDGDSVAPSELVEAYLPVLMRRLRRRWRWLHDEALVYDAATDALLAYVQHPARYDPARGGLLAYLTMSAHRDLQNALKREAPHDQQVIWLGDVAQSPSDWNVVVSGPSSDPADLVAGSLAAAELARWVWEALPDPLDRQVFQLMAEGERQTAAFSAVLGIAGLDIAEQRRIVKRRKDRIIKRLQRRGEQLRE